MKTITSLFVRCSMLLLLLPGTALASLVLSPSSLTGIMLEPGASTTASIALSEAPDASPSPLWNYYYIVDPSSSGSYGISYTSSCPTTPTLDPSCTLTVEIDSSGLSPGTYGPVNVDVSYSYGSDCVSG